MVNFCSKSKVDAYFIVKWLKVNKNDLKTVP